MRKLSSLPPNMHASMFSHIELCCVCAACCGDVSSPRLQHRPPVLHVARALQLVHGRHAGHPTAASISHHALALQVRSAWSAMLLSPLPPPLPLSPELLPVPPRLPLAFISLLPHCRTHQHSHMEGIDGASSQMDARARTRCLPPVDATTPSCGMVDVIPCPARSIRWCITIPRGSYTPGRVQSHRQRPATGVSLRGTSSFASASARSGLPPTRQHTYTRMHAHKHTHTHTHVRPHAHIQMLVRQSAHKHEHAFPQAHTCTHACTPISIHTHACTPTSMHARKNVPT